MLYRLLSSIVHPHISFLYSSCRALRGGRMHNDLTRADASFLIIENHGHRWSKESLVGKKAFFNVLEWLSRFFVSQWVGLWKENPNREISFVLAGMKCSIINHFVESSTQTACSIVPNYHFILKQGTN